MKAYPVDGEVGRFSFDTYSLINVNGEEWYNTAKEFFPPLQGTERYRTEGFNEIALIYGVTEGSFRKTSKLINRVRHQEEGGTPSRRLNDHTENEGKQLQKYFEEKTESILEENGFTSEGPPEKLLIDNFSSIALEDKDLENLINECAIEKQVKDSLIKNPIAEDEDPENLINECAIEEQVKDAIIKNPVAYENAEQTVHISLDDVCTKQQKETRKSKKQENSNGKTRQYVQNTVIHVQKGENSYLLNGHGVIWTLKLLLAFLLNNHLIGLNLVFFVDGHSLYSTVILFFAWHNKISVILDWFHLEKKCKERLSMALKGSKIRNGVLEKLMPLLWHGLVDEAMDYLKNLPQELIRNEEQIQSLIDYLEKNKPMIPVYSIRKRLGLRNSSNRVEKANDLIVAERQKHMGMAWSKSGSVALASLTSIKKNQEYKKWFHERKIEFKLAS